MVPEPPEFPFSFDTDMLSSISQCISLGYCCLLTFQDGNVVLIFMPECSLDFFQAVKKIHKTCIFLGGAEIDPFWRV